MTSANISLEKKIFHRVENVVKQLVHTSAMRSSRYEARRRMNLLLIVKQFHEMISLKISIIWKVV